MSLRMAATSQPAPEPKDDLQDEKVRQQTQRLAVASNEFLISLELIRSTAQVVSAYVSKASLDAEQAPELIHAVYAALKAPAKPRTDVDYKPTPMEIRKSITRDGLRSFEDGKVYKALKRSLTARGLTPDTYRAKWGLPDDYPMVASAYSAHRSALAKAMKLGCRGRPRRKGTDGAS